jgi:hypothetical protein
MSSRRDQNCSPVQIPDVGVRVVYGDTKFFNRCRNRRSYIVSEPSLFDEPEWKEVPQARFLSWTPAEQLAYCAERDKDAAEHADHYDEAKWLLARAADYERDLSELRERSTREG